MEYIELTVTSRMTVSVFHCFVEGGNFDGRLLSIAHGVDFYPFNNIFIFTLLP